MLDQTPEEVPWTLLQTLLGIFLSLIPWLLFSLGLGLLGGSNTTTPISPLPVQEDIANAVILFVLNGLVQATFLIGPLSIARYTLRQGDARLRTILHVLSFRAFKARAALPLVFLSCVGLLGVNYLYQWIIDTAHLNLQTNSQAILQMGKVAPMTMYALLFLAVFIAPVCEEVLFRGFVFAGLLRKMPLAWAIFLSAFFFALIHADLASFPVLFCIGLLLAFLRWRTRSLWPGIFLHWLNNGWGSLTIILTLHGILHP